ncbi:MAG: alkaline phosphatase, partial [Cyanobacteria bacterium J06554_11]
QLDADGQPLLSEEGGKVDEIDTTFAGHYWGSDPAVMNGWAHHTTIPVPVYYQGAGSQVLTDSIGSSFEQYGFEVPGIEGHVDQVHLAQAMEAALLTTTGTEGDDELVGTDANETINALAGNDIVAGGLGNDVIDGGDGDDILRGDTNSRKPGDDVGGDDIIFGGAGSDRIGGKGGNDTLVGGEDDDLIWGDDGDDLIFGGLGNDTLTGDNFSGGQGTDTFVLAAGEGTDTIVDFEVGTDLIGLAGGLSFGQLTLMEDKVLFGEEVLAMLNGVSTGTLTEVDFVAV